MKLLNFLTVAFILIKSLDSTQENFLGCYTDVYNIITFPISGSISLEDCLSNCYVRYYKYALVRAPYDCICTNYIGELQNSSRCNEFCHNCDLKDRIHDAYITGFKVLGPPTTLKITNVTEDKAHVFWNPPELSTGLKYYRLRAKIIKTYSRSKLDDQESEFTNDTYFYELNNLHPGTVYNITVQGVSDAPGVEAFEIAETKIGVPSTMPKRPDIISREGETMKIRMEPVENDNGPVTSYLIVVINKNSVQVVDVENLESFTNASNYGLSYYIAAELTPDRITNDFTVGDGKIYGEYYNAPLLSSANYDILLGVKSVKNDVETRLFSSEYIRSMIFPGDANQTSGIDVVLISGITIVSCLIVIGLGLFVIIRRKFRNDYRQRLNDIQELRVQGPMIDIENHGYIADEPEGPVNHYKDLKERVWMIPHHSLNVDNTFILGQGRYGHIYKGTLEKDNALVNVAVYNIADRRLNSDQKYVMLKDMDVLIKSGKHKNVLEFIGTCENIETVAVILEYSTLNLKEYLIASRIPSADRFTTLPESQLFDFAIGIADGLNFLHTKKIIHNKICARHVSLVDGTTPKIAGYGLSIYYKDGKSVNCTRWTAREVLKGQNGTIKSDIWSFACLIWEMCALGATPHWNVANHDVTDKIVRGLVLPQLKYMDDSFYQVLLDCWQMNIDERPKLTELMKLFGSYKKDTLCSCLNFKLYNGFEYEPYNIDQELNNSVY